jgi:UDP-N-acetyl-2-amino-2-deoxyglucuronate dehydrogenase
MGENARKRFAMIGAAGYIAPRHMKAIKETGHDLVAALDPSDSVGIIDSYFPDADFFTEFERFDRHIDKLRRKGGKLDYVTICSPNYLHDAHIRFALRNGADAICEKPVVLNPWNLDPLQEIERETGCRVFTIQQLRLHPVVKELKSSIQSSPETVNDVNVTYIAPRGHWYQTSWKGEASKSGGISTNIGLHLFDAVAWIWGPVRESVVHINRNDCAAGVLQLARARVRWFLSINSAHLAAARNNGGTRTYRSITVNGREMEFSDGFGDLHTDSYREILAGRGFGLDVAREAIQTVYQIRNAPLAQLDGEHHTMCDLV